MPELTRLGAVVDIRTGNPFKSSGYSDDSTGVRLLRGDNVGQGRIRWDKAKYWPASEMEHYTRFQLRSGDVIIAMDRPWIEAGLKYAELRSDDVPSLLVQRTACLRARNGLNQRFLSYLIGSQKFTDYILGVQTGTAVPHISAKQISDFTFELPEAAAQLAIGQFLGALDDKLAVNDRVCLAYEELLKVRFRELRIDVDEGPAGRNCRFRADRIQSTNPGDPLWGRGIPGHVVCSNSLGTGRRLVQA